MKTMMISSFLLKELYKRGVRHIYGVPGDYILPFAHAMESFEEVENVTMSAEEDTAWSANLVGRQTVGVCYATFMVGCLNMLNSVCDAAKNLSASSLVLIGGEIALADRQVSYILHHQTDPFSVSLQENVFQILLGKEYAKSIIDISTASEDIVRLITLSHEEHRPVYIGIPKDLWDVQIADPPHSLTRETSSRYPFWFALAAKDRIEKAKHPVILVGQHAERFGFVSSLKRLAEIYAVPIAVAYNGHGSYPLDDPFFIGTYAAQASCPIDVQKIIEESDCLIRVGVVDCDMNYGLRPPQMPRGVIDVDLISLLRVGEERTHLSFLGQRAFLEALADAKEMVHERKSMPYSFSSWMKDETDKYFSESFDGVCPIAMRDIAPIMHQVLQNHPGVPIVADIGNAMVLPFVSTGGYYTSSYGAMGVTAGALGVELARKKRPVVVVGDGAFGMWSLGSLLMLRKYQSKQIIVILNNGGWGMLRPIAQDAPYLDIPYGNFEELARFAGYGLGFRVETPTEFMDALNESFAVETFSVINVILSKDDAAESIKKLMTPS